MACALGRRTGAALAWAVSTAEPSRTLHTGGSEATPPGGSTRCDAVGRDGGKHDVTVRAARRVAARDAAGAGAGGEGELAFAVQRHLQHAWGRGAVRREADRLVEELCEALVQRQVEEELDGKRRLQEAEAEAGGVREHGGPVALGRRDKVGHPAPRGARPGGVSSGWRE